MKKLTLLLLVLAVSVTLIFAGCSSKVKKTETTGVKVYFFYEKGCPNCMKIEPYMKFLREKIKNVNFYFCDLSLWGNCSKKAGEFLNTHRNLFPGFIPCPTAVIVYKNYTKVLIGYKNISKIGYYLGKFNIKTPEVFINNTEYNVSTCISCHEKEKIPPPSKYNCTYCCHFEKLKLNGSMDSEG